MNTVHRTRPGHWAEQKPFVMPTNEEIAEADERHDIKRANSWMPFLLPLVPLLVAVAVHLYFR
ncbi:hypothetical protein [Variovorax sp. DXTD-1]|uniref:hypothetical protein n=1 Tax=Variovorax sp. DXTD-1 TaxID=2495592 RepID=UPI000F86AAB8|nr:hypothetical protein [Variovorax sp. DXTD-1]RST54131.1 hypothetical protein EJI00_03115 [Variovorax sp. DXTD-1]